MPILKKILFLFFSFLATGDSYRTIANSYRVGHSTVSGIVPDVARAIWECLVDEFITDDWQSIAAGFQDRRNFLNCVGSIDGKHIVIQALRSRSGSEFHNYKGTFSLVLLAVVDSQYQFRVIDVGTHGSSSDAPWPTPHLASVS